MGNAYFDRETNFMALTDELTEKPGFRNQVAELTKNIQLEEKVRSSYFNALTQKDSTWWKPEIEMLNTKIREEKNDFARQTYIRIKGFLGIVCYSYCQRFEGEKDAQKLEQVLLVYRMSEPRNPEMLRFTKVLDQMKRSK